MLRIIFVLALVCVVAQAALGAKPRAIISIDAAANLLAFNPKSGSVMSSLSLGSTSVCAALNSGPIATSSMVQLHSGTLVLLQDSFLAKWVSQLWIIDISDLTALKLRDCIQIDSEANAGTWGLSSDGGGGLLAVLSHSKTFVNLPYNLSVGSLSLKGEWNPIYANETGYVEPTMFCVDLKSGEMALLTEWDCSSDPTTCDKLNLSQQFAHLSRKGKPINVTSPLSSQWDGALIRPTQECEWHSGRIYSLVRLPQDRHVILALYPQPPFNPTIVTTLNVTDLDLFLVEGVALSFATTPPSISLAFLKSDYTAVIATFNAINGNLLMKAPYPESTATYDVIGLEYIF